MAEFLDTKGIDTAIKDFEKCLNNKGLKVKIDPKKKNEPGLENLLFTLVEFFDKVYATALAPYAKLVDLAKRIKASLTNPTQLAELVKKVNELITDIQKAVSNIIKFVIEKITEPLQKYAIPLTIPVGPLSITLSDKTNKIKDKDRREALQKYIKGGGSEAQTGAQSIVTNATEAAAKARKKAQDVKDAGAAAQKLVQDQIAAADEQVKAAKSYLLKIIKDYAKVPEWLQKQITLLLSFIQTAIDFILSGLKAAIDALKSPTKKLIELLSKLISNPAKFFFDLLRKALEPVLIALAPKFTNIKEGASKLKADVKKFLDLIFSFKKVNLSTFTSKVFQAAAPFFALIACSMTFAIKFLPIVIKSLIKF